MSKLDTLREHREALVEQYGDLKAQYQSEVAQFGDAWPGAAIDLHEAEKRLAEMKAEIDTLEGSA